MIKSSLSKTPFADTLNSDTKGQPNPNAHIDFVGQARSNRARLKGMINHEKARIEKFIAKKTVQAYSRFKYIRRPINTLKFNAEIREWAGFQRELRALSRPDSSAPYVNESVHIMEKQIQLLTSCVQSSAASPCGLIGCPMCSPLQRVEALAEAAAYLSHILQSRKNARFFSFTVMTNEWTVPLYEADSFMKSNMAHTLETMIQNLPECTEVMFSIDASFTNKPGPSNDDAYLNGSPGDPIELQLQRAVFFHLHGVLVTEDPYIKDQYVGEIIEQVLGRNAKRCKPMGVCCKSLNVGGLRKYEKGPSVQKWLAYMTKWLTADLFDPVERRAMRLALHDACRVGLLSTGPILYSCQELTRGQAYVDGMTMRKDAELARVDKASPEQLLEMIQAKLAAWGSS